MPPSRERRPDLPGGRPSVQSAPPCFAGEGADSAGEPLGSTVGSCACRARGRSAQAACSPVPGAFSNVQRSVGGVPQTRCNSLNPTQRPFGPRYRGHPRNHSRDTPCSADRTPGQAAAGQPPSSVSLSPAAPATHAMVWMGSQTWTGYTNPCLWTFEASSLRVQRLRSNTQVFSPKVSRQNRHLAQAHENASYYAPEKLTLL